MVYQFSYPPLVLDAFIRKDSRYLQKLFKNLEELGEYNLFFNFLASHDGIGVLAAKDFLKDSEFKRMLKQVKKNNGHVSFKKTIKGQTPYEMNINYFDAINNPNLKINSEKEVKKFIASQSILVFSKGVPGIYIHSLLGSRNCDKCVKDARKTMKKGNLNNIYRRINREKLDYDKLEKEMGNDRGKVFESYKKLLRIRSENKDFSPYLKERVVDSDKRLLILEKDSVYFVVNVSDEEINLEKFKGKLDLVSRSRFNGKVEGYDVLVLK